MGGMRAIAALGGGLVCLAAAADVSKKDVQISCPYP